MTITYNAIETHVVTSNTTSIVFSNLPTIYDDLSLLISGDGVGYNATAIYMQFNNDTGANYSRVWMEKDGSAATPSSYSQTAQTSMWLGYVPGTNSAANAFGNTSVYIPNFRSNIQKSVRIDSVSAAMSNDQWLVLLSGTWQNTSPITSINIISNQSIIPDSTITLYGIKKK